uniref:Uncharacterized protein n=1 Tax=Ralstonia solanacearum TaxID=305 RepID=A0A0S4WE63_RALSL|nr:protein of unknown function [Ralstonia solanacearum]
MPAGRRSRSQQRWTASWKTPACTWRARRWCRRSEPRLGRPGTLRRDTHSSRHGTLPAAIKIANPDWGESAFSIAERGTIQWPSHPDAGKGVGHSIALGTASAWAIERAERLPTNGRPPGDVRGRGGVGEAECRARR